MTRHEEIARVRRGREKLLAERRAGFQDRIGHDGRVVATAAEQAKCVADLLSSCWNQLRRLGVDD
jgi:hypothetical protein